MQTEITRRMPLLDENGNLTKPGFARSLLWDYRRDAVKAGKLRIKEWDYYLVICDEFALALTIADNSYMGLDSISLLDFSERWQITKSPMHAFPLGGVGLPETSEYGDSHSQGRGYSILFKNEAGRRTLIAQMRKFGPDGPLYAKIVLDNEPRESMVIATPFDKPGHFYYNQKINCMRASGEVAYGSRTFTFPEGRSFAVLDWGRGVWTYHNTWYWSSGNGQIDGVPFGWNLGYGFGNTGAATENMLFYDGRAHKLGRVRFNIPKKKNGRDDFMKPWTISSDDGRVEMDFVPVMDRAACTDVKLIKSDQHQVFGRFTGRAVLSDGTVISIKDFMGFAEKVENKW